MEEISSRYKKYLTNSLVENLKEEKLLEDLDVDEFHYPVAESCKHIKDGEFIK